LKKESLIFSPKCQKKRPYFGTYIIQKSIVAKKEKIIEVIEPFDGSFFNGEFGEVVII
jgi:hypothetical protein